MMPTRETVANFMTAFNNLKRHDAIVKIVNAWKWWQSEQVSYQDDWQEIARLELIDSLKIIGASNDEVSAAFIAVYGEFPGDDLQDVKG